MRARIAGAIMGAAALCLMAGAAQAQSDRPAVPEAWGSVGSYGQPHRYPLTYNYGQPGRTYDYGYNRHYSDYRHGGGYRYGGYRPRVRQGYRDDWGYQDDRPHTAPGYGRGDGHRRHGGDHHDGCGCPDVYLYDR